ncbi:MAG: tetratricopeptide repeat protein [Candidatus Marinimicrobia bacterium]|nr:tetratricopeptide repeat protein [Candidatus Neomarinimicrobiota bacterium]
MKTKKILTVPTLIFLLSILVFATSDNLKEIISKADYLDDQKLYQEELKILKKAHDSYKDSPEILWRLARAHFNIADQNSDDLDLQKENLYPGFEYAKKCIEIDKNSAGGHKYYAILIGRIGEIEGTKQKITNSYAVKEHALIAIKLDPTDDANYHLMGRWHYALSDLSWIERQIATVVYGKLPKASFEEAEFFFKKAHELAPDDPRHLLWLGKTQLKLGKKEEAKKAFEMITKIKPKSDSEKRSIKEASELLKKIR